MKRTGSQNQQSPWKADIKGFVFETDFTLKGNGIVPMTSSGKRRNIQLKQGNHEWVLGEDSAK